MPVILDNSTLWAIVSIGQKLFAIDSHEVQALVTLPTVVNIPNVPKHTRGVINLRGKVIPVIDLRIRLGFGVNVDEDLISAIGRVEKSNKLVLVLNIDSIFEG